MDLRRLRDTAGAPSCRTLAGIARKSATTLAEAANGRKLPSLEVALAHVRACRGDKESWTRHRHDVVAELKARATAKADDAAPAEADVQDGQSPHVGLRYFTARDADLHFGRERLTADVLGRADAERFVVLFGASGTGKSLNSTTATTSLWCSTASPVLGCS